MPQQKLQKKYTVNGCKGENINEKSFEAEAFVAAETAVKANAVVEETMLSERQGNGKGKGKKLSETSSFPKTIFSHCMQEKEHW